MVSWKSGSQTLKKQINKLRDQSILLRMKIIIAFLFLVPLVLNAQRYKEQINFNSSGDQTMALGRYQIGAAIRIEVQISGGWSQDGGIYHIVGDWGNIPRIALRSESSISERLKFFGYVDPNNQGQAFLFATWDNQSPSESYGNDVKFTIYTEGTIDINSTGNFSNASPLYEVLSINATSKNVGIGVSSPTEKLEVNGNIRTQEIKVEASPWPDHVFEDHYLLPSLKQTEDYIKTNKHLPGIPPARQVAEEGISLGKMNAKLLEKIEELTLHVIELEKKNNLQDELIQKLIEGHK